MMSNILHDIPFSHNQPLKLAEYVELSKINKAGSVRSTITLRRVCVTVVAMEKQLSVKYSECMTIALVIWHAYFIICVLYYIRHLDCLALPHFSTLSHTRLSEKRDDRICFGILYSYISHSMETCARYHGCTLSFHAEYVVIASF
jgi:hypothetical protein